MWRGMKLSFLEKSVNLLSCYGQKNDCSFHNSYVKNSKLCNILTYKDHSDTKTNHSFFIARWCCFHWAQIYFYFFALSASFVFSTKQSHNLCVKKDSYGGVLKKWAPVVCIWLIFVTYALCILTTIKGIDSLSTCAMETCFILAMNENLLVYFASLRAMAGWYTSLCTVSGLSMGNSKAH